MMDSRPQLQAWVDENVENGNLFKRGTSVELDAMDAYEVSQLFEIGGPYAPYPCTSIHLHPYTPYLIPYTLCPMPYTINPLYTEGPTGDATDSENEEAPTQDDGELDPPQVNADSDSDEDDDNVPIKEVLALKKTHCVKHILETHKPLQGENQDEFAKRCMVMYQRGAADQSRLRSVSRRDQQEKASEEAFDMEESSS